ncbi:MAG: 4Fe-4S dicluster domain-containing protein [Candidatus Brockarchaeota archaeon]|nr:4Fe-4S dicluster domain-containing protein [Candidatus Brockarchaeota archaeon]
MAAISPLAVEKAEDERFLIAYQRFYVDSIELSIDKSLCIRCDVCSKVCPKEAISVTMGEGKAVIALDEGKCVLCGACEPLCPAGAIKVRFNGKRNNVLVEKGGFPTPPQKLAIEAERCPERGADAARACPRGAMKLEGGVASFKEEACLRCPWCEDACVHGAVKVNPLFLGRISIDDTKCSKGCDACAKVCPTAAIKIEGGKARVAERYCVFCNACSIACKDDAITLERYQVFAEGGFSSLWSSALSKLLGQKYSARIVDRSSMGRLRSLVSESRVP